MEKTDEKTDVKKTERLRWVLVLAWLLVSGFVLNRVSDAVDALLLFWAGFSLCMIMLFSALAGSSKDKSETETKKEETKGG